MEKFRVCKPITASIVLLGSFSFFVPQAKASPVVVIHEDWQSTAGWILGPGSDVSIPQTGQLRLTDARDQGFSALMKRFSTFPQAFKLDFSAQIKSTSETTALGVTMRTGSRVFRFVFRARSIYSVQNNSVVILKTGLDAQSHNYSLTVAGASAKLYMDGNFLAEVGSEQNAEAPLFYIYSDGQAKAPAQAQLGKLLLTYEQEAVMPDFFTLEKLGLPETKWQGAGSFSHTYTYEAGTNWTMPGMNLDPLAVHKATLRHTQDKLHSWEMRVGKGGQIYSFTTAAGELIPPQFHPGGEWMDEVFQVVGVNTELMKDPKINSPENYYIHQAGTYWAGWDGKAYDPGLNRVWYSPMLADKFDAANKSYMTAVWGQQAHIPSVFKSGLIYYTTIKDLGDGVIEMTYILKNFGQDKINYINVPWGGVRRSVLPDQFVSKPDNTFELRDGLFGDKANVVSFEATNGWFAWSNPNKLALGLVFGKDANYGKPGSGQRAKSNIVWGNAGSAKRDYNVFSSNMLVNIMPGDMFYARFYFVVGTLQEVAAKAPSLVPQVSYGILSPSETASPVLPVWFGKKVDGSSSLDFTGVGDPSFYTYTVPPKNSVPLFKMRDNMTGKEFASTDPYRMSSTQVLNNGGTARTQYRPYDGRTSYLGFLGYVMPSDKTTLAADAYVNLFDKVTDRTLLPLQRDGALPPLVRKTK